MYRIISVVFSVVFATSLMTINYFNHFYAEKALQKDAEQLLYQFHDTLLEAHKVLEALPDPEIIQCNDATRELLAKYSFESPAIRLIGVLHGEEQFCASEPIHIDLSHYHQRLMQQGAMN